MEAPSLFVRRCSGVAKRYMCKKHAAEATFETKPYKLYMLDEGPAEKVTLTRNAALDYYKAMYTIRRMETEAASLYQKKKIRGFCHLYNGQEAVAVGFKAAMRPDDCLITSYRAHGWTYIMGVPIVHVISELTGKKDGCSRGKGGSMHMYSPNFFGGNGIVGAQVPIGLGISLALKYQGKTGLCLTIYGDGAANQGQVFESFNIAKLWNIPIVFICENNLYGMGTTVLRSSASTEFYKRGHYIPGIRVEGQDILTVREAAHFAINYATVNSTPIVIEATTYRYYGHSMSDPGTSYRTRDEVQDVRVKRDPVLKFREKILTAELVSPEEIKTMEGDIKLSIVNDVQTAELASEVSLDELTADIYAKDYATLHRGIAPYEMLPHKNIGKPRNF